MGMNVKLAGAPSSTALGIFTAATTGTTCKLPSLYTTFQATGIMSAGTGAGVVDIEVSNDEVDWITMGTISLSLSTTSVTDGFAANANWRYIRAKATTVTANGTVTVTMGG